MNLFRFSFEGGIDRHRMSVPQFKIFFKPCHDISGFCLWIQFILLNEPLLFCQFLKVGRCFACLYFYVLDVCME